MPAATLAPLRAAPGSSPATTTTTTTPTATVTAASPRRCRSRRRRWRRCGRRCGSRRSRARGAATRRPVARHRPRVLRRPAAAAPRPVSPITVAIAPVTAVAIPAAVARPVVDGAVVIDGCRSVGRVVIAVVHRAAVIRTVVGAVGVVGIRRTACHGQHGERRRASQRDAAQARCTRSRAIHQTAGGVNARMLGTHGFTKLKVDAHLTTSPAPALSNAVAFL